ELGRVLVVRNTGTSAAAGRAGIAGPPHSGNGSSAIAGSVPAMAIARYRSFVLDCPDPGALAAFYAALLDWKAEITGDWADIRSADGQCISFQQVEDYTAPQWPGQQVPQQMHLDVIVDDLDAGEAAVLRPRAT